MDTKDDILTFWLDEVGPEGWYRVDEATDAAVRARFGPAWERAGEFQDRWFTDPRSALALLILTDQFPRNMFRGDGRAFATDPLARSTAKRAVRLGWDTRVDGPGQQFFYMPLMHSEVLPDQDQCVRLMLTRLGGKDDNLLHARVHREIIRRFGRFPFRNAALGRKSTAAEERFVEEGGYGALLREMKAAAA